MLAGGEVVRAFGVNERPAACDAHASIVGFVVALLQKLGGMGGNHGQLQGLGDFQAALNAGFPVGLFGQALQFQIKGVGKPCGVFLRGGAGFVFVAQH